MSGKILNLSLPGNPRYQPKDLRPIMGYDMIAQYYVKVELAVMEELGILGVIPQETISLLTPDLIEELLAITTTEMDAREREVTGHDIRALVQLMQERMPEPLRKWVHVPLTSYDVIDTARACMFKMAHKEVIHPKVKRVLKIFADRIRHYKRDLQIGRTHGQHAVPITIGFWLATVADRILTNAKSADALVENLVGKIAGPVGAKNALTWLTYAVEVPPGVDLLAIDQMVGERLGIKMAPISTQIVPPEPLANYLHSLVLLSGSLAQFANDCRHLMRSEIAELHEEFEDTQVGSSTMAHKRNPITFEGMVGAHLKTVSEYLNILMTLTSEHQRDLTASSVMRDFPTIGVNVVLQLEALLRPSKKNKTPFLGRVFIDVVPAFTRAESAREESLAEPLYLFLQTAGQYEGDAHNLVSHLIVPQISASQGMLETIEALAEKHGDLKAAWKKIPKQARDLFMKPDYHTDRLTPNTYVGQSSAMAEKTMQAIEDYLGS